MKTFKIKANYIVYLEHIIMAKDEYEAFAMAIELDGGEFSQVNQDDWKIYDVVEVEE